MSSSFTAPPLFVAGRGCQGATNVVDPSTRMKLRLRDIVSHQGKDYVVEGMLTYRLGGKAYRLARLVDGDDVRWLEPLTDDLDDRVLLLQEIEKLDLGTPPPPTISYDGKSYLPR